MPVPDPMLVFDRALVRRRRERAVERGDKAGFLFAEVAARLADRLVDVRRHFEIGVDLGSRAGHLAQAVIPTGRAQTLFATDMSPALASRLPIPSVAADEEALPFAPASLDLVVSTLALHWVNDLPGALVQIRQALKPDGLFLAGMFGGETLRELREVLMEAELAVTGGVSPRVSPMADLRDAAGLLQRAGFALPVADRDMITVAYPDAVAVMRDLSAMGEGNAVRLRRRGPLSRAVLAEAASLYQRRHSLQEGRVRASFEILYLSGWAPAATQQRPLRPGQATARLADALGVEEQPAGDFANPNPTEPNRIDPNPTNPNRK
jgi:NADH dehydrogenase [ubiquinone] 1 alpha subcomplex assembly factor 5